MQDIIGESVNINDEKLEVIGVLKENGSTSLMMDYDSSAFMPYDYTKKKLVSGGGCNPVRIVS